MAINVEAGDIVNVQRLAMLGTREGGDPQNDPDRRLMIVYTGWIGVTLGVGSPQQSQTAISFVPNGPGPSGQVEIQTFKTPRQDQADVEVVVTASLSSFGSSPDVAAIDKASVSVEKLTSFQGDPRVIILRARLSAAEGAVHGISYQVTVLVHPDMLDTPILVGFGQTP
jgi:hypothetical protein